MASGRNHLPDGERDTINTPSQPPGHREEIRFYHWKHELAFESIGPTGGEVKEGLHGAPIIRDDEGGGVEMENRVFPRFWII